MSVNPFSNIPIHQIICKVQSDYKELGGQIHLARDASFYYNKWLSQIPTFRQHSFHNAVSIALWDVISNRFLIAIDERKILQYDTSLYTDENGVDFSLHNFHPDYIHAIHLINRCISECLTLYQHLPPDKMIANLDALYRIKDGSYIHILQQIVPVETDEAGHPFLFLSYVRNVTYLKKHPSASLVFTTPEENKIQQYNFATKRLDAIAPFTKQEKILLQLLSEGKQTRFIANELFISPHTVDTHRRNMLAKMSCIDSTALIAYCRMIGLI